MKPCQVDWQKLVITEILFCYREIELINIIKQNEKLTLIYQWEVWTGKCFTVVAMGKNRKENGGFSKP